MRLHRFYIQQPLGEEVVITDQNLIHQWIKVFRYTKGDFVILFNGDNTESVYSLETFDKKALTLKRSEIRQTLKPSLTINLVMSMVKKDNFELVVQKATELGVTTITPLITSRTEKKGINYARLATIAKEAAEQSGRGTIPLIEEELSLEVFLSSAEERYLIALDPTATTSLRGLSLSNNPISLIIGPEGGFTEEELTLMEQSGVKRVTMGRLILRAETAAISSLSLLLLP